MQSINGDKYTPHSITVTRWRNHASEYAALITGPHSKYRYKREFCKVIDRDWSRSGFIGNTTLSATKDGIYEIQSPGAGQYGTRARYYVYRAGGKYRQISEKVVHEYFRRKKP